MNRLVQVIGHVFALAFLLFILPSEANITVNMRNGSSVELDAVQIIYPGNNNMLFGTKVVKCVTKSFCCSITFKSLVRYLRVVRINFG